MSTAGKGITPILGTMTFGANGQITPDTASMMVRSFIGSGCTRTPKGRLIDTAGFFPNDAEDTLGQVCDNSPSVRRSLCIATQASAEVKPHCALTRQSVIDQCDASLEKLGVECVHLFSLNGPDIKTDIDDTLDGIAELHQAGKIVEFGLCNYPAWAVVDIWHRCKGRDMVLPTVYHGKYNVLSRDLEREIMPVLREFGLRLHVYNPLAGGLLSGRYGSLDDVMSATEGRFSQEFDKAYGGDLNAGTVTYRDRYAKPLILDGLDVIRKACAPPDSGDSDEGPKVVEDSTSIVDGRKVRLVVTESKEARPGLNMANVALRWLIHHSCLTTGDGIILGVSKSGHLVGNLAAWRDEALDSSLLAACEEAWDVARPDCEPYFHGYGAKPGGIEAFLKCERLQETGNRDGAGEKSTKMPKAE